MYKTSLDFCISSFCNRRLVWLLLVTLLCSFIPSISVAQQPTATIKTSSGDVLVSGQAAMVGTLLRAGETIQTQAGASVVLELSDGSELHLGEKTQINIDDLSQTATGARVSHVKLLWGRIRAFLSPQHQIEGSSFDIETPNALIGVKFSEPDIEVSYNLEKAETVGIAHTVELMAKNLLTDEEVLVPVGSSVIITAVGMKVITGIVGIVGSSSAASTGTGTASTTASTGSTGMSTGTKVAIGVGAAAAVGGVAAIAASSGGETAASEEESLIESAIASVNVFCVRFPVGSPYPESDNSYWVEAYIVDPQTLVESATIRGSYGASSLTYNKSPRHPGWWWTDPNIFISQDLEPDFPLYYTVHIMFKDGTTRDVSKTVTTWEWAE